MENQGTNEDESPSDAHPEAGIFRSQITQNSVPEIACDMVAGATEQIRNGHDKISKLPKSLTTAMHTFDRKSEKFQLFEDLFQTSWKIHNQLTDEDKLNYFHSLMRGDALQTFKTSAAGTERIWQKSWLCSVGSTWNPSQWLRQNTNFNN